MYRSKVISAEFGLHQILPHFDHHPVIDIDKLVEEQPGSVSATALSVSINYNPTVIGVLYCSLYPRQ
jgi:hypothetical protein